MCVLVLRYYCYDCSITRGESNRLLKQEDMSVLDGVRVPIERSAALLGWRMAGEVLIPGVLNEGDIAKTDGVERAAALAESL